MNGALYLRRRNKAIAQLGARPSSATCPNLLLLLIRYYLTQPQWMIRLYMIVRNVTYVYVLLQR